MIERFLRWLRGYLHICLYGEACERFLNLCNGNDILLWNISYNCGRVECFIRLKDYKSLHPIARKCKMLPRIKKRFGFPFIMQHILKRKVLVFSVSFFLFSIFLMSQFIWNISFEGEYRHSKEQLLLFLEEQDVYTGCSVRSIDCPDLEALIRKEYPDIGWVSVELKGTRLFVRLKETTQPTAAKEELETSLTAANIIAEKNGIILSMIVRSGTPKVKIGDVVKKGDILVSGVISVLGDDAAEIRRYGVVADADITMASVIHYRDKFPMKYTIKQYTGKEKNSFSFLFMDRKIFSYNSGNSYKECDIISEEKQLKLSDTFYLPFLFKVKTIREYKSKEKTYTKEEAKALAEQRLSRYTEDCKKNGIIFSEKSLSIKFEKGNCIVEGTLKTEEEAWNYAEIPEDELLIMGDQNANQAAVP